MALALSPARTARLFSDIASQQQTFPTQERPTPLPHCPTCRRRPNQIVLKADGTRIDFDDCGHAFTLSRAALLVGIAAQRTG